MQTKLTLRLEEKLIQRAKQYAEATGKSLSQVVAEYFCLLDANRSHGENLTPIVKKLRGSINEATVDREDYGKYLAHKYQ